MASSSCPFQSSQDFQSPTENLANSEDVVENAKPVPYQWWKFGLLNLFQLKKYGWNFYKNSMDANKSTVFSVKLDEWTTCVGDHVGMESVLDLDKVERDDNGHGFLNFRKHMMRGHVPCLWSNEKLHDIKKPFLLDYAKESYENMSSFIIDVVQKEFEHMDPIKFDTIAEAKTVDCERIFNDLANKITCLALIRETFDSTLPIDKWRGAIFQQEGILFPSPGNTVEMTNKIFSMFETVEKLKDLGTQYPTSGLNGDEMFNELLYMTCCNASPGVVIYTINSLLCYIRLSQNDKQLLKHDADIFFKADNYRDVLSSLKYLHSFFMEVLRAHPLPVIYGRAKKDFVMKSTSGNFSIKKGSQLCGMPSLIQSDDKLFENPFVFDMHRSIDHVENYNFGYGGFYNVKSSEKNHKCAGVPLSMEIVKVMIIFYTRCTFVATDELLFTGKNILRKFASDEPLHLLEFSYDSNDETIQSVDE